MGLHEEHPLVDLRLFFLPLTVINVSGLAPAPMASAAGLGNFMRITGSSVGIAVRAARGRALTGTTPINLAVA